MDAASIVRSEGMRPLRRAEYDRLVALGYLEDEHVELLHGVIVPISPQGTRHAYVIRKLADRLAPALAGRAQIHTQSPFAASDDSEPEPDLAVVPVGDWLDDHPDRAFLVVEVTESSHRRDLGAKVAVYAASGVPEYWVVDLVSRSIIVHADPRDGRYGSVRTIDEGDSLAVGAFPDVAVAVGDLLPPR